MTFRLLANRDFFYVLKLEELRFYHIANLQIHLRLVPAVIQTEKLLFCTRSVDVYMWTRLQRTKRPAPFLLE